MKYIRHDDGLTGGHERLRFRLGTMERVSTHQRHVWVAVDDKVAGDFHVVELLGRNNDRHLSDAVLLKNAL